MCMHIKKHNNPKTLFHYEGIAGELRSYLEPYQLAVFVRLDWGINHFYRLPCIEMQLTSVGEEQPVLYEEPMLHLVKQLSKVGCPIDLGLGYSREGSAKMCQDWTPDRFTKWCICVCECRTITSEARLFLVGSNLTSPHACPRRLPLVRSVSGKKTS